MNKINVFEHVKSTENLVQYCEKILNLFKEELSIEPYLDIELYLVDSNFIHKLNLKTRKKDQVTDVISIRNMEKEIGEQIGIWYAGSIYICVERVEKQAQEFNHSYRREFIYLFSHGLLHILGYDHQTKEEDLRMRAIISKTLSKIGMSRYE